jgi:hypothetical protein
VIKSRIIRWARNVAGMRERKEAHGVLEEKSEGKRPLGRPRHKWKDNIKIDLRGNRMGALAGLIWLRIGTYGGLLYTR